MKQLFGGKPVIVFREEVDRRRFLKGAAVVGIGAALATRFRTDPVLSAQQSGGDLDILNYALTLEYLEADFYTQGVAGGILEGRELELVTPIRDDEQAHVTALTAAVTGAGGTPAERPMFTYPEGTFTDRAAFLETASVFEELGVQAYHGQVPLIMSAEVLGAAASIAGSESRHAAILAVLNGGNPFPAAFEGSMSMEEVLEAAMPFLPQG